MTEQRPLLTVLPREYRKYVTAELPRQQPIYNWFVFPHSFSKELVIDLIDRFDVPLAGWVSDLFVGAGTTVLACKQRGINAWGYDVLPLPVMITRTKVATYQADILRSLWSHISAEVSQAAPPVDIPIINQAFSQPIRDRLHGILQELYSKIEDPSARDFFHLALLHILEDVSCTQKSGGWLKVSPLEEGDAGPLPEEATALFRSRVNAMIQDVQTAALNNEEIQSGATLRDARKISRERMVDAVITSPPYLNRHDYTRVFALELVSGFVQSQRQLKSLRYSSLRSHPEAKAPGIGMLRGYEPPPQLLAIKQQLPTQPKSCDARVHKMIDGYFEDMYLVLRAAKLQLKQEGHIAFVIGNVRFGGISIAVDEIVGTIGEMIGLKCTDILVARERGNSAQQMRDHGQQRSRESIVIWKNS
jgi:hypothetical protein